MTNLVVLNEDVLACQIYSGAIETVLAYGGWRSLPEETCEQILRTLQAIGKTVDEFLADADTEFRESLDWLHSI